MREGPPLESATPEVTPEPRTEESSRGVAKQESKEDTKDPYELAFRAEVGRELKVEAVGQFSPEGLATCQDGSKHFFVNREKQLFGPFEKVHSFSEGFAQVKEDGEWYLMNAEALTKKGGAEAKKFGPYHYYAGEYSQGAAPVCVPQEGQSEKGEWRFVDTEGSEKGWGPFKSMLSSWSGHWLVKDFEGNKFVVGNDGQKIEGDFSDAHSITGGFALMATPEGGRKFRALESGKELGPFRFAFEFSEGLAPVQLENGKWCYVDEDGNEQEQFGRLRMAHPFFEGKAIVQDALEGGGGAVHRIDHEGVDTPAIRS